MRERSDKTEIRPTTCESMIAWLKAHPGEPFFSLHSGQDLLIGTRDDEGGLFAYRCVVTDHIWEMDRPEPKRRRRRTR